MKLYLIKSDIVKCRFFFTDEAKAKELYDALKEDNEHVVFKYLATSDEYEVVQLIEAFNQNKECL